MRWVASSGARQVSDKVKELALDALLDVCRGNEVARREFGGRGVIESLLPLIRHATMCTKALEALWMLCFDTPDNIARVLGRFRGRYDTNQPSHIQQNIKRRSNINDVLLQVVVDLQPPLKQISNMCYMVGITGIDWSINSLCFLFYVCT
jgi:hypothetical protein